MDHIIIPLKTDASHATQANLLSAIRDAHPGMALAKLLTPGLVAWFESQVMQGKDPDIFHYFHVASNRVDQLENETRGQQCIEDNLRAIVDEKYEEIQSLQASNMTLVSVVQEKDDAIEMLNQRIIELKALLWDMSQI